MKLPKIITDTLMYRGKWSRKSLTAFISFIISVLYGVVFDVLSGIFDWNFTPKEFIFFGFLSLAGGALTLTVIDKIRNKRDE